jgi:restriction system protein
MSIWEYCRDIQAIKKWQLSAECPYCRAGLTRLPSEVGSPKWYATVSVYVCNVCGWWRLERRRDDSWTCSIGFTQGPREIRTEGMASILKVLDPTDIALPCGEVRDYLLARYDDRYKVHPRAFEEVVASVFQAHGFATVVTAYSGDGGLDVILSRNNETTGVQVKRYRNSIKVEQIRSLVGALVLQGQTRGIFVTTSRFQAGSDALVAAYHDRGVEVKLLDADRFYDALKIARRVEYRTIGEFLAAHELSDLILLDTYRPPH